jgi:inner membrane protein YidH
MSSGAVSTTELAVDRTRLAHERTLMAWTRTGTSSLISFGFTIYKLLDAERPQSRSFLFGPLGVGMFMVVVGLVALALATIEHHRSMQEMRAAYGNVPRALAAVVAGLIAVLGIVSLTSVVLHV